MHKFLSVRNFRNVASAGAVALLCSTAPSLAQDNISGSAGYSVNSHFVSYGLDVWGAGDGFLFDDQGTNFFWFDVGLDLDPISINFGAWTDVNNNLPSGVGGNLQELDIYIGAAVAAGNFSFGATFQQWFYASDTEGVLDFSVSFDDSEIIPMFPLSPSVTWHIRTDGNGGQAEGSAVVIAIGPSLDLGNSGLSLSFPAGLGFFLDDDFQGGWEGGLAYGYIGGSLGIPLSFIPMEYGEWSVNADLIGYFTKTAAIPGNAQENFLTSSLGISVAY
jgi:hypothetical protein